MIVVPRQLTGELANVFKLEKAEPTIAKKDAKRTKVWYGPFTIPALNVIHPFTE
jgi:hypothetical protein